MFRQLVRFCALPVLTAWLAFWLVRSWPGLQDDALIHLRYADFLYHLHFITYDGIHPSYGTSSLLYVGLLAAMRSLTTSVLVPRILTTVVHILLFVAFAIMTWRASYRSSTTVQALLLCLLATLAAPSAVRWLDEGMETGIVLCFTIAMVAFTHRLSRRPPRVQDYAPGAALGFGIELLRNELGFVAFFCTAVLCIADAERTSGSERDHGTSGFLQRLLRSLPARSHFLVGSVLAALAIRVVMHHFLPDTALAKSAGIHAFWGTLAAAAAVLVGSVTFGLGSLLLWLLSTAAVLSIPRLRTDTTFVANLVFPCLVLLSAIRGQQIQGMRYLIWALMFSTFWNLLELLRDERAGTTAELLRPDLRSLARSLLVLLALFVMAAPVEAHWMGRALQAQAQTTRRYMRHDLDSVLADRNGVAADVGYIGYFTQGSICDLSGLVNGRAVARLTADQQMQRCVATHPVFILTNPSITKAASALMPLGNWSVCGVYDHGNLTAPDRHYLLVSPELAPAVCAANHFQPMPAEVTLVPSRYP